MHRYDLITKSRSKVNKYSNPHVHDIHFTEYQSRPNGNLMVWYEEWSFGNAFAEYFKMDSFQNYKQNLSQGLNFSHVCLPLFHGTNVGLHSSPKPDSYKMFSCTIHLSTSGGKQDVYSILLEALPGNIKTLLTMVQESYYTMIKTRCSVSSLQMFLIRCYKHPVFHQMLISTPGMKRFCTVLVSCSCVTIKLECPAQSGISNQIQYSLALL